MNLATASTAVVATTDADPADDPQTWLVVRGWSRFRQASLPDPS